MNHSNFKLHGISPIYDQVIFVRCHLCQLIIKLPHLVEHLQKRHNIINDSNDAKLSEQISNEQLVLAQNEEKSQIGIKGGKKTSRAKQQSHANFTNVTDSNGTVTKLAAKQSTGKNIKGSKAGRTAKSKLDKNNELKKEQSITNANLPLLSSILDESINDLNHIDGLINGSANESLEKKEQTTLKHNENNISANQLDSKQKHNSSTSPNNNQIRFKYSVEQLKINSNGTTSTRATPSPVIAQKPSDFNNRLNKNLDNVVVPVENSASKKVFNPESCVVNFQDDLSGSSIVKDNRTPYKEVLTSMPSALLVNQPEVDCDEFYQETCHSPTNQSNSKQNDSSFNEENKFESFKFDRYDASSLLDEKMRQMNGNNMTRLNSNLSSKATKVYDPNKHCGVVVEQYDSSNGTTYSREPCTRSLTCKKHSINLRRQVTGRCKSFNELFKEYRDEKLSTNQLVNTNKLSNNNNEIITPTTASVSNSLTPPSNIKICNDSKKQSSSVPFSLPNYHQQNNELSATSSNTPPGLKFLDLLEFKSEGGGASKTNASSLNHLQEPRNLINEFDYMNYQSMQAPSYQQQSHDYFMNNVRLQQKQFQLQQQQQQQQQQQEYQQNQYQSTLNQPYMHDHTLNNNSIFKPFLTGLPLNAPTHPTVNNLNKNSNYQPPNNMNNQTQRPLSFEEISQQLNLNYLNKMLVKHHPRPSAVTSFNSRMTDNGGGYTLWDRRQDNLRLMLSNAFSQTENFLNKNHSFTSNLDQSIEPSNMNFETKSNGKYKNNNDSVVNNTTKQEQNTHKRTQSASLSEQISFKQNKMFSPTSSKSHSKNKASSSSKKRSTSSSLETSQKNPTFSNNYDPSTSHFIPVKQPKSNNVNNSLYNTEHTMSIDNNKHTDEFRDNYLAEDDCLNGRLGGLGGDLIRSNFEQSSRGLNDKSRMNHQNNNFHNRFVKEESIMLNGHSINYTGETTHNNGYNNNKNSKYPIRAMPSSLSNQHKPYLSKDNIGMEEVKQRSLQSQNKPSKSNANDIYQASKFLKYSTDSSKMNNSNESSRNALKSMALTPSPSSSSSASNSSSLVGVNKPTVYNTVN